MDKKIITQKDIQSLGWCMGAKMVGDVVDYSKEYVDEYNLSENVQFSKLYINQDSHVSISTWRIDNPEYPNTHTVFSGFINNKEDLKTVMRLCGIVLPKVYHVQIRENRKGNWWVNGTIEGYDVSFENDTIDKGIQQMESHIKKVGKCPCEIEYEQPKKYPHERIKAATERPVGYRKSRIDNDPIA